MLIQVGNQERLFVPGKTKSEVIIATLSNCVGVKRTSRERSLPSLIPLTFDRSIHWIRISLLNLGNCSLILIFWICGHKKLEDIKLIVLTCISLFQAISTTREIRPRSHLYVLETVARKPVQILVMKDLSPHFGSAQETLH